MIPRKPQGAALSGRAVATLLVMALVSVALAVVYIARHPNPDLECPDGQYLVRHGGRLPFAQCEWPRHSRDLESERERRAGSP